MFIRKWQRGVGVAALAACAPMVVGCATTNRFVVDPDLAATVHVEAISVAGPESAEGSVARKVRFDAAGGRIDAATMSVLGTTSQGRDLVVPLTEVERFYFQDDHEPGNPIKANPAALVAGSRWRPEGKIQYLALRTGEVRDVRQVAATLDPFHRAVICTSPDGPAAAIPFEQIVYVQMRESHPGRTFVCVIGGAALAVLITAVIVLSTSDFGMGWGGESN